MKSIYTAFFLLALSAGCLAQKYRPALNLKKGSTYYIVNTANSTIVQSINGQENKVNLTINIKMAFKVTDVTDTIYKMDVSYQLLDMKVDAPTGAIEMDSRKKDSTDIASSIFAAMMNKPFTITLSKSGKVQSVDNIESMINNVFNSFPKGDAAKKDQIKSQFLQSFGAKALKGNIEIATAVFPGVPVVKNDKWTVNTSLEAAMTARMQTTYQLIDASGPYYQIHGEGTITTDNTAPATLMQGLPIKYDLTGSILSDIKADKATGWVSELKLKQLIKGNIDIQDNPKVPGGMSIPIMIDTNEAATDK